MIKEFYDIYFRFWQHNGGDPYLPRRYREILREAGFTKVEITGSAEVIATLETSSEWGQLVARLINEPIFLDTVTEMGWADRDKIEEMRSAWLAWGEHPDAFYAIINAEGVGWKE